MFGIADDADDLAHQPAALISPVARTNALAQRVLVREITARQRLVDDGHWRGAQFVVRVEVAASDQLQAYCLEVTWRDEANIRRVRDEIIRCRRSAFDSKTRLPPIRAQRQMRNGAGVFDSRQAFKLRNQFLVKRRDLRQLGVAAHWERDSAGQYVVRIEARIDALQPQKTVEEQPATNQ